MSQLISESDLMNWTKYSQRAALRKWLIKNKIPYREGKEGELCVVAADLAFCNRGKILVSSNEIRL